MKKINSKFRTNFLSEDGGRLINRDYFAFVELDQFACYVIADGLDEDPDENSARLAVETVIREFTQNPGMSKGRLRGYIRAAHRELLLCNSGMRLKASVLLVATDYEKARYILAGNSRFYLIREGIVLERSRDQSLTANLVEEQKLELDKAALHEERNNLYCYLGQEGKLRPEISKKRKLADADLFLMLTRGIWEYCDEGELIDASAEAKEPQEILDSVEEMILSAQPRNMENYTLAATFADKIYRKPSKRWTAKKILLLILPIVLVLAILGGVLLYRAQKKKESLQTMKEYMESGRDYAGSDNFIRAGEEYDEALKLAKKLKKEKEKEELTGYQKLFDQIFQADELWKAKDYQGALEAYLKADGMTSDLGNTGREYIAGKLEKARAYIDILDYLAEGDRKMDHGDRSGAREAYLEAKNLANQKFYQEGKQEAIEKIDKIDQQIAGEEAEAKAEEAREAEEKKKEEEAKKAEEEAKKAEEEAKKAEEEAKKAEEEAKKAEEEEKARKEQAEEEAKAEEEEQNKLNQQMSALEMEKKGNAASEAGNYEDAKMYYGTAQEMYRQAKLHEKADNLGEKIQLAEKKNTRVQSRKSKADNYLEDADAMAKSKQYEEARLIYCMARDIYEEAGWEQEAEKVDKRIESIDKILAK